MHQSSVTFNRSPVYNCIRHSFILFCTVHFKGPPLLRFDVSKTSWLGGRYGVLFFTFVVSAAFIGIWTYQHLRGQESAIVTAEATAANLARAIEDSNSRTIQAVNLILANVAAGMKPGGWAEGRDGKAFLQSLLNEAPQVREVAFADARGRVSDISRRGNTPSLSIAQEPYFQQALEGRLPPMFISKPYGGRLLQDTLGLKATRQWHLIAARTVLDDDGVFVGLALAVINPGFFQEQIEALEIGQNGFVTFYRYDGEVLVQGGGGVLRIGDESHADHPLFAQHLAEREWGTFRQGVGSFDGAARIISYRATTRWPLLVAVNLDMDEALAPWRQEAWSFSVIMAGGLTVLLILAFVVYRQRAKGEVDERRLILLGTALETTANMVLITDVDASIVWVNAAFCEQFGYTFDEVIGVNPRILKSGMVSPSVLQDMWDTIHSGRIWNGELINRRKDGSLVIVNQTISPIVDDDGLITHFVGIHDDITKRKEVENELREAKIIAESANTVKTQFLANMSHELRTPLNAVLGFIDMMRLETFGPLGHDKYREYSSDIHTSASHLLTLISDILDVSKIEAGKMDLSDECIHLADLAETCRKLLDYRAKEKGVALNTEIALNLPELRGDDVRIKQIVLNLLTNAIKFTPAGGQVTLRMDMNQDGGIVLHVEDSGVGIAAQDLGKVLEPFGQAGDTNTLSREGVGLGLYLVKAFAEMHGGRVAVSSQLGVGTQVSVIFPPERSLPFQDVAKRN